MRESTTKDVMTRFGVNQPAVSRWVKAGCPQGPKVGNALRFDLTEVAVWVEAERRGGQRGGDHSSLPYRAGANGQTQEAEALELDLAQARAKLRKDLALATKAEIDVAKLEERLLDADEVKRSNLAKVARARAVLLGGPASLASDMTGDPEFDEKTLSEWVHRALTELSQEN